jgi:hypothetical protein
MATKYDVLSPDGFSISFDEVWDTPQEAEAAQKEWAKRYEQQGYYSSNGGRIPLAELADHCRIIPVELDDCPQK